MRKEIKVQRAVDTLAAMLAAKGIKVPDTKEITQEAIEKSHKPPASMEAEAVLLMLQKPAAFTTKKCKRDGCGELFGTNYHAVGYCTDNCRRRALASIGITWDSTKRPDQRWGGEPPLIVPPEALAALKVMLLGTP